MEEQLEQTTQRISQILTQAPRDYFLLYLPFTGSELNEFLCSCFHRRFVDFLGSVAIVMKPSFSNLNKEGDCFCTWQPYGLVGRSVEQAT